MPVGSSVAGGIRPLEIIEFLRANVKRRPFRQPKFAEAEIQIRGTGRDDSQPPESAFWKLFPGAVCGGRHIDDGWDSETQRRPFGSGRIGGQLRRWIGW